MLSPDFVAPNKDNGEREKRHKLSHSSSFENRDENDNSNTKDENRYIESSMYNVK